MTIKSALLSATLTFALAAGLGAPAASAQPAPNDLRTVPAAPTQRRGIELGGGAGQEQWETFLDQTTVRNVTGATLYPVLPPRRLVNGHAVIVAPGGGYRFVSIDSEGFRVAEALAAQGYTAFVLKYRTVPTARDSAAYLADTMKLFTNLGKGTLADNPPAVDDLAAAIAHVRAHASEWNLAPEHVNVVGFSAGARTLIRLIESKPEASQLETAALLYPPMVQPVGPGPRPPLFLAIASDDPLFRQGGLTLLQQWLGESRKVELHLYAGGSHGFGMKPQGTTSDLWIAQYIAWLQRH